MFKVILPYLITFAPVHILKHYSIWANIYRGMDILEQTGRGADFFGLTHPVIQNLIQSSPGAKRCTNYKWVKFEISKTDTNESVGTEMLQDPTIGYDACRVALIKGQSLFPDFLLFFIISYQHYAFLLFLYQHKAKVNSTQYSLVFICSRVFWYLFLDIWFCKDLFFSMFYILILHCVILIVFCILWKIFHP